MTLCFCFRPNSRGCRSNSQAWRFEGHIYRLVTFNAVTEDNNGDNFQPRTIISPTASDIYIINTVTYTNPATKIKKLASVFHRVSDSNSTEQSFKLSKPRHYSVNKHRLECNGFGESQTERGWCGSVWQQYGGGRSPRVSRGHWFAATIVVQFLAANVTSWIVPGPTKPSPCPHWCSRTGFTRPVRTSASSAGTARTSCRCGTS